MANKTTNYNLTKPLASEFYDVADQNGNMDIIDAELKKNADAIGKVEAASAAAETSGTGAAYTAEVTGITELFVGLTLTIIPHTQSTTTEPTLNLNSLGAKKIKQRLAQTAGGTASAAATDWIVADKPFSVRYDGADWIADTVKLPESMPPSAHTHSAGDITSGEIDSQCLPTITIDKGGTGAETAAGARENLGAEKKHITATATLTAAGWNSNKSQTVGVTDVTAGNDIIVAPAPASQEAWGKAGVVCTAQATGTLTFSCKTVPTDAVAVNILIFGG